jgi:hypothetical protein
MDHMSDWSNGTFLLPKGELTEFANCTDFKDLPVLEAYTLQLRKKWASDKRKPKWTNTSSPEWSGVSNET